MTNNREEEKKVDLLRCESKAKYSTDVLFRQTVGMFVKRFNNAREREYREET